MKIKTVIAAIILVFLYSVTSHAGWATKKLSDIDPTNGDMDVLNGILYFNGYDYHDNGGYGNVLGSFTVNRGSDDRGEYIDYYDVWDLNPISSTMKAKYSEGATNAVRAAEDFFTRDVMGMKAPEIYGRIYFDELDSGMRPMRTIKDKNAQ